MAESHSVKWTPKARKRLSQLHTHIKEVWSEKEANHFLDTIQQFELVVTRFPLAFPLSLKSKVFRKAVVHMHTSIIYRVKDRDVIVVTLLDNRSKP